MKGFAIRPKARPILSSSSRASVEAYFVGLRPPLREQAWLDLGNRYRLNCTHTFERDAKRATKRGRPLARDKHKDLAAYVGASSPAHVIDGWSFLGRALDSAVRGDTYSAAHFAYYAELRAAMALLASEGIGIFSRRHAAVGMSDTTPFPKKPEFANNSEGTHRIIWPVFRFWSSLRRASDLLDELIQPGQIRLSTWLAAMKCPVPVRAVGQRWLSSWGLDLETVSDDHDIRNLASYRPSEFRYAPAAGTGTIAEFVSSLWALFEPGRDRRFHGIERHLLRSAWRTGGGNAPSPNDIERIGLSAAEAENWADFLSSADDPSPLKFAEASTPIEDPSCHLRMISRAALLLFVASGAARQLLHNAGYSAETIGFWWKKHGVDRGLWATDDIPDDPMDAWADIALAMEDLASWRNENIDASLRDLRHTPQGHIHELGAFELVGIWSLLP